MKTLQNNFTTLEQSKRLLELGVPADNADCIWWSDDNFTSGLYNLSIIPYNKIYFNERWVDENGEIVNLQKLPCWSVGRLMEIYDMCFISPKSRSSWCTHTRVKGILFVDYILDCYKNAITDKLLDFSNLEE